MKLLNKDLEFMFSNVQWEELRDKRILITGGSGFVGSWVIDSLLYAKDKLQLGTEICVLTRDFNKVWNMYPNQVHIFEEDIRTINSRGHFDYILHFASHDGHRLTIDKPVEMFDVVANGAWQLLKIAQKTECGKLLYMSSGAVNKSEVNPYVVGKRMGEYACKLFNEQYGMNIKIARGFDFVGARLPLEKHFAIGNFIKDILNDQPVNVKSDGLALRSYLYMADVVVWLWKILFDGVDCIPYNIGSDKVITIGQTALKIAYYGRFTKGINIYSSCSGVNDRYYPEVNNVLSLGLKQQISLDEALNRTIIWFKEFQNIKDAK